MGMENTTTLALLRAGADIIGVCALYPVGGLELQVNVLKKRTAYGRIDVLIEPTGGHGTKWVDIKSLGAVIPVRVEL